MNYILPVCHDIVCYITASWPAGLFNRFGFIPWNFDNISKKQRCHVKKLLCRVFTGAGMVRARYLCGQAAMEADTR